MANTFPGINQSVKLSHFEKEEKLIIQRLSSEWYVTNGGGTLELSEKSNYRYFLLKPCVDFQTMFNIEREIAVVFSPYKDFEPRTLDAFERVYKRYPDQRLENVCCILISQDKNIKDKISSLLQKDPESRVIIPFSYNDFLETTNNDFIKNRFRNFFFERDLFAFESPITKDFFFFGRNSLIHKIINRHKSNENSGLFGLRKTGKTSVINGIVRALKVDKMPSVVIDCQDTAFNQKRWHKALFYIISEIKKQNNIQCKVAEESEYDVENASTKFEKDLKRLYSKTDNKPFLIIFDEIENISPITSPNVYWKEDLDFVSFWQTVRSKFQKFIREENAVFSFLVVGTNPKAIETSRINDTENPIFNNVPFEFIQGFTVEQTTEMVSKLGGYMGLNFDDTLFGKLRDDYGGHPYLIRHLCSITNELTNKHRPASVDKTHYAKAKTLFNERYSSYLEMVLEVLVRFYPEEYEMLNYLAVEDFDTFNDLANLSPDLIAHLKGYNVIEENDGNYYFKIEAIKEYLKNKNKYKIKLNTTEDKWKEISERRNKVEPKLRQLVRMQLQAYFGKPDAFKEVVDIYGEPRKTKLVGSDYNDLFDAKKTEVYFSDLTKIISKHYNQVFKNIFGSNKDEIKVALETINKFRTDAHAKEITNDEMDFFRVHMSRIEKIVNGFI
ncbi:MAG: AAA-like domain-containing protein [Chitinispirillales bacterium]|jgi:shikimate kinase|nr:AAA-like domain-containing protein [Chitinispirillales bacterium]